jgi:membrane protein DedA with SNARE-associated domain
METLFIQHFYFIDWAIYLVIFIGMVLEGEAVLFTAFYLAHQGYLNPQIMILVAFSGTVIGDLLWYVVGEHLEKTSVLARKIAAKISKHADRSLVKRPMATLFIGKFTYGLYHGLLLRAGALKINLKMYFKTILLSSFVWMALIGGLAYFSSVSASLLKHYFKYGEIGLVVGIIFLFLLTHFASKFSKREIED